MAEAVLIEVSTRTRARKAAAAKRVNALLASWDLGRVSCLNVSKLYRIHGGLSPGRVETVARDLLSDPIVEDYSIDRAPLKKGTVFADVWYKAGVTDAVGESVLGAIGCLGISGAESASSGVRYEFSSGPASDASEKLPGFAKRELLNPLVQECRIRKP
ncbi:MAG: hypothetical protein A2902_03660 [Elusimicrobia bacterium RIFCSPLOWO2_01_FULL_64_13]|nr:MAG: hypothetical protein A2636_04965 [Elusimicrobia bacterium RIFCSPHIGHO2_01_FULL_64_10]OGR97191.1 MAG: hypothetical protein A2902_03660 [Elusimicrobia bacterium RIFCSPLOWO2_01_FULL_64_13]